MKILITGGTGFIGSALCSRLLQNNHDVTAVSRQPEKIKLPVKRISSLEQLNGSMLFDIVINLAGEPIANKRWSHKQKQRILNSRIITTSSLIDYFKSTEHKPQLLISASAIGYYGIGQSNEVISEDSPGDESFASQLCQQWEAVALGAQQLGIRVCLLRTGIVLGKGGGALGKMLLPFKLGLGGKIGQGKQWMSWIHLDDLTGIILYCMDHDELNGPVNGTSPGPVTNEEFTKTLGKVLNRPAIFSLPAVLVKLLLGQMGVEMLLTGKKILPVKMLNAGYKFNFEKLDKALGGVVAGSHSSIPGKLAAGWGIIGVCAIIGSAIYRLAPIAAQSFTHPLQFYHWLFVIFFTAFMAYSEGYMGFQKKFSPRVVSRALYLTKYVNMYRLLFAPLFCMGYFYATKRRLIISYMLTAVIVLMIAGVKLLSQPWRGFVDTGVVVGLAWGVIAIGTFTIRVFTGKAFTCSPETPDQP